MLSISDTSRRAVHDIVMLQIPTAEEGLLTKLAIKAGIAIRLTKTLRHPKRCVIDTEEGQNSISEDILSSQ